jgi:hypothetical protein
MGGLNRALETLMLHAERKLLRRARSQAVLGLSSPGNVLCRKSEKIGGNMKFTLGLLLALATAVPALANKKPVQACKVSFAFVYVDRLDNTNRGLQGKQLKDVQKKLSKYGDCLLYSRRSGSRLRVFRAHKASRVSRCSDDE